MTTYGSLFSGVGGLDLAVEAVVGAAPAWHSEVDPNASKVLAHHWPTVPNLGDITRIDWAQVQPVDILCGGFPCQDISSAGRGAGIKEGTRSGLWYRYTDAVRVLRPRFVFVENVSALLVRGLDIVVGDLASLGYVGSWLRLRASDVGAPHQRARIFLLAWPATDPDGDGFGRLEGLPGGRDEVPGHVGLDVDERGPGGGRRGGVAEGMTLLPTPTAANPNDGEDLDGWLARRERVKESSDAGNGFGMPLSIAVRLLPTPRTSDTNGPGVHGTGGLDLRTAVSTLTNWGPYEPAIRRWEALTRPAPSPVDERGRLNPELPEWMMGFDAGWITDHLTRTAALKAAGNAVCPQQATAAFGLLIGGKP
mgnify:CR=1 FL=1